MSFWHYLEVVNLHCCDWFTLVVITVIGVYLMHVANCVCTCRSLLGSPPLIASFGVGRAMCSVVKVVTCVTIEPALGRIG